MKENIIGYTYQYLEGLLDNRAVENFENRLDTDLEFSKEWKRFLVEQFLSDSLNDAWRSRFEELRKIDSTIEVELEFQKGVQNAMRDSNREELRKEVAEILPPIDMDKPAAGVRVRTIRYVLIVAAAFVGMLIMFTVGPWKATDNASTLYAEYFELYPMLISNRAASQSDLEGNAVSAYQSGDFQVSMDNFNALVIIDSENAQYILYAALSALEISDTKASRALFSRLKENDQYREQVNWYTALSWLKDGDVEKAREALDRISKTQGHYYMDNAKKLLVNLDQLN